MIILAVTAALVATAIPAVAAEGPLTVTAPESDAEVLPGSEAVFPFSVENNKSLPRKATLELLAANGSWPAVLQPEGDVDVRGKDAVNGTLHVSLPTDAAPGNVHQYTVLVTDKSNPLGARTSWLNFTVKAKESGVYSNGSPALVLEPVNGNVEAAPGETLQRAARLALEGRYDMNVRLAAEGPDGWSVRASPTTLLMYSAFTQNVGVNFTVPADAEVNSTHLVVLHATSDDGRVQDVAAWTVTVVALPPAPDTASSEDDASTTNATAGDDAAEDTSGDDAETAPADDDASEDSVAETPARVLELMTLTFDSPRLDVGPGESAVSALTITNPSDSPRTVTLTAPVDDGWVVVFEEGSSVTVPANGVLSVRFSVTAPADAAAGDALSVPMRAEEAAGDLAVTVADPAAGTDAGAEDARADGLRTQDAPSSAPIDAVLARYGAGPVLVAAGAVTAMGGGIWLRGAPHVRRNLWWLGVGAYTRLTRPKLLDHEERQRLYATVQENPGIHFHALQRELGWNTGALTYHLRVLERHQMITSRRDGIMRRFYLVGTAPREMPKAVGADGKTVTLTGIRGSVMTIVNSRGRVPQATLVDELGTSKQSINYHVKNLERMGLIQVERVGRETFLSAAEDVQLTGLEHAGAVAPNADATAARPGLAMAGGEDR